MDKKDAGVEQNLNNAQSPFDFFLNNSDPKKIKVLLEKLSDREKEVLGMRFSVENGRSHTLKEIGLKMGISKERVRQIEEVAIRKLKKFIQQGEEEKSPEVAKKNIALGEKLRLPISELQFSVRSMNCLREANIKTVGEIVAKTEYDLLCLKNFGKKSISEIKEILAKMGLGLKVE